MQDKSRFKLKVVIVFLLIFLAGVLTSCDSSSNLTDAEHVANAKDFLDKGDINASIVEFKNALQKNPENAEARRLLGINYVYLENGAGAEKELRRALGLGVAKEAILIPLAKALQLQVKNQEILDEITITPALPPHDQATLAAYRGDAWLALGKPDKARAGYIESLKLDPSSPLGKQGLGYLAAAENDTATAIKLLEEALQVAPQEASLWRFKAELHKRRGELKNAEEAYNKAIDNRRRNETDRANRALLRIKLQKFDQAAKDINLLKKTAPNHYLTHFADGYLRIAQGNFAEAREPLEQAIRLNERYPFSHYYLGLVHLSKNELQQADQYLTRFKRAFPNSVQAHEMLALAKFKQRDFQAARSLLMPVVLSQPDDIFALNLMANIEFSRGNASEGLLYLQKVAELKPEVAAAKARLGIGLLASGQKEKGLEVLEAALAADPKLVQPDVELALTYIRDKDFGKAREAIDRLKAKMPDNPLPLNLEAMLYVARSDKAKAKTVLEQALVLAPGDPMISENLARLAFKAERFEEVRRLYEGVLQAHPKHPLAQLKLAEIDLIEGKFKAMEERLNELIQEQPEFLQPRLELARYYLRFGQLELSQTLLENIRARYPEHPDLLAVLTEAQLESKQGHRALETAKALEKAAPRSALAQYLLARAYDVNGDAQNLRATLERTLANDPKFLPARLAMVKLLALEQKPKQAERELNQLVQEYPDNPEVMSLKGWWAMNHRQPQKAAESYRKALAKQPRSALAMQLANALWGASKQQEALKVLEEWNHRYPQDAAVHYLRSNLYQAIGKEKDAQRALAKILEINPKTPLALNDLAWLLRKKDPKQALVYAEEAYTAAPKMVQVIDTLAMVLVENGQPRRALQLMEQAVELATQDPSLRYHLAVVQEKNDLKQEAITNLNAALASKARFPERQEAEVWLTNLPR